MSDSNSKPTLEEGIQLRSEAIELWRRVYDYMSRTEDNLKAAKISPEDAVDIAFVLASLSKSFDAARKDCNKRKDQIATLVALHISVQEMENPGAGISSVTGRLAKGFPDIFKEAQLPKMHDKQGKLTEEYLTFMRSLNVPEEIVQLGIIKPDWKGVSAHITNLARKGIQPPAGLGKNYVRSKMTLRRRPDSAFAEVFDNESETESDDE